MGQVWKFGPNVNTDAIIPAPYVVSTDALELAKPTRTRLRIRNARGPRRLFPYRLGAGRPALRGVPARADPRFEGTRPRNPPV